LKNAMALKAWIRNRSQELKVPPQALLQQYVFERFLVRLEQSTYARSFYLKGGGLISAFVGIAVRSTMDLDFTVQGISLQPSRMESIIREILAHDDLDFIHYDFVSLDTIQEDQEYAGLRISLEARFETLRIPLKIDLTTGDILTPSGMICEYPMIGEDRTLHLYSYNLETMLAEKLETILSRGVFSTRARDYYDVYILEQMQGSKIHRSQLFDALVNTMKRRESDHLIP